MAWSAPIIHAVGDVLTASDWNVTSNDLSFVAGTAFAEIATSQATTSGTYVDLSTVGPSVTVTTGSHAIVAIGTWAANSGNSSYASYAVSGATTVGVGDQWAVEIPLLAGGAATQASYVSFQNLTAGSNTFTMKYRVNGGTGNFANRYITVWPLP